MTPSVAITLTRDELVALSVLLRLGADDWDGICEANGIAADYERVAGMLGAAQERTAGVLAPGRKGMPAYYPLLGAILAHACQVKMTENAVQEALSLLKIVPDDHAQQVIQGCWLPK